MFSFYLCSRLVENKEIVRRFIAKFMVLLTDLFYKCMQNIPLAFQTEIPFFYFRARSVDISRAILSKKACKSFVELIKSEKF